MPLRSIKPPLCVLLALVGTIMIWRAWEARTELQTVMAGSRSILQLHAIPRRLLIGSGTHATDTAAISAAGIDSSTAAPQGRYRYLASLRNRVTGDDICLGSLVHPRVVLTAAHCIHDHETGQPAPPGRLPKMRIGGYRRTTDPPTAYDSRRAVAARVQPAAAGSRAALALLLLDAPSSMPTLQLASGQASGGAAEGSQAAVTLGWSYGGQGAAQVDPQALQQVGTRLVAAEECQRLQAEAGLASGALLCAAAAADAPNICGGSGGPLLVPGGSAGEDLQLGVALSWGGSPCGGGGGGPGIYASVPAVLAWVEETVAELTGEALPGGPLRSGSGSADAAAAAA